MALRFNINDNTDMSRDKMKDTEEIKTTEEDIEGPNKNNSTSKQSTEEEDKKIEKLSFSSPDRTSFGTRCRTFIQGGQRRGKTLLGRGRRISKTFGSSITGSRSNRYLVGSNNNISQNGKSTTVIQKSTSYSERARRSRLAEDALFYEDTFEAPHIYGHVTEESPKKLLHTLYKKSKSKRQSSKSSSLSQSPVAKNCICLKYCYPPKKANNNLNETNNATTVSPDEKESQPLKTPKTLRPIIDNKTVSEIDTLHWDSPTLRPNSVDMGMLLSLSLTDPIVTSFNNNGILQRRANNNNSQRIVVRLRCSSILTNNDDAGSKVDNNANLDATLKPATHTQIDFTNFLIPGQRHIIQCPFYWGKIDRYEAEALLADKPEGSFLLRDSAQDDFVFSVSFRRYSRSLHARIEEDGHMFSFDSHDPGVHASHSIRGLLEHYKDPLSCMFFEPMLLFPVVRKSCFSLQSLARASICDNTTYTGVTQLPLPKVLKQFLREYHYKHKIRTRYIDTLQEDESR